MMRAHATNSLATHPPAGAAADTAAADARAQQARTRAHAHAHARARPPAPVFVTPRRDRLAEMDLRRAGLSSFANMVPAVARATLEWRALTGKDSHT
jgi:hypothetical protein